MNRITCIVLSLALAATAAAHDSWVETDRSVAAVGDEVRIDLCMGNHGNDHRDFKLMGKVDLASSTLELIPPDGEPVPLKEQLAEAATADDKPYWTTNLRTQTPGLYIVSSTSDKVVSYAPKRSIKSAKAIFAVGDAATAGHDRVLGHPLELVPVTPPIARAPSTQLVVRLLYKGQPLTDHRVSIVPRGVTLKEGFDKQYERLTDTDGLASFPIDATHTYLIVAHHEDAADRGEGYDATKYSATLTVSPPGEDACCEE